jgi:hypothetical protein
LRFEDKNKDHAARAKYRPVMNGGMVAVHDYFSANYVCELDTRNAGALNHFLQRCPVVLERFANEQYKLFLAVYGFSDQSEVVGELLAEDGLFLQHPRRFDERVPYVNPQYLSGPMTKLEIPNYRGSECSVMSQDDTGLQQVKGCYLKAFDAASSPSIFSKVKISKSLTTDLLKFVS